MENSPRTMLVLLSNTMHIYTGFLLGSKCTHAYNSPRTILTGTNERTTTVRTSRRTWLPVAWPSRSSTNMRVQYGRREVTQYKLSLAQIPTTTVDHNESCHPPSDWQSELGLP